MNHIVTEHRMSDAELRKAIKTLQSRADDARRRGAEGDATRIERTVADYDALLQSAGMSRRCILAAVAAFSVIEAAVPPA